MFEIPPLFELIRRESGTDPKEMYKVFNMGHRMEIYCPASAAEEVIARSRRYGVDAKVIGRIEEAQSKRLTIVSPLGTFEY